jgi:hypothetical protein
LRESRATQGGDCFTARAARRSDQGGSADDQARLRRRRDGQRCGDADLDAYVKEVVDNLPPLTEEQRDLLALIFRSSRQM